MPRCRKQQRDQRDDFEIAPVFAGQDFPNGGCNDEREKTDVDRSSRKPFDVGGNRHDDPSGDPHQNEHKQRLSLNRKLSRPVRDRGEKKSRDHRRQIAVEHLMDMPVPRRERRMQRQLAMEDRKPDQHGETGIDASEEGKNGRKP